MLRRWLVALAVLAVVPAATAIDLAPPSRRGSVKFAVLGDFGTGQAAAGFELARIAIFLAAALRKARVDRLWVHLATSETVSWIAWYLGGIQPDDPRRTSAERAQAGGLATGVSAILAFAAARQLPALRVICNGRDTKRTGSVID